MFDFHCHILPGVDDGAQSWTDSLAMARAAANGGVKTIVATPHYSPRLSPAAILALVEKLNGYLAEQGITVTILPGAEAFMEPELPALLKAGQVLPINGTYVLVELPFNTLPIYTDEVIFQLTIAGYHVILAHPERNLQVAADPELVFNWVSKGVAIQINTGSILGVFGSRVKQCAEVLLKAKLVHFIGSDAHSPNGRRPNLPEAYQAMRDLTSSAQDICQANGALVLLDKFVLPMDFTMPKPPKHPWWRRMFNNE